MDLPTFKNALLLSFFFLYAKAAIRGTSDSYTGWDFVLLAVYVAPICLVLAIICGVTVKLWHLVVRRRDGHERLQRIRGYFRRNASLTNRD